MTEATDTENNLYGEKRLEQLDDITMLALRYNGNGYSTMTDKAKIDNILKFNSFVDEILAKAGFSQKASTKIRIAIDEIFSNICYYSGAEEITVGCKIIGREADIYFEDDGIPYNPLEKPDPDVTEVLERRKEEGLGFIW